MKSISELKKEQQDKLSAIFEKYGIFFAFNAKQFNQQKEKGVKYVSGNMGMIIPKDRVDDFHAAYQQYSKECVAEHQKHIPMDNYIAYELANYEALYTGDMTEAFGAVQAFYPECTLKDMWRVYKDQRNNH